MAMRHSRPPKPLILAACILSAALLHPRCADAAWETNWPSWQYPFQSASHLRQVCSGALERASVAARCYGAEMPTNSITLASPGLYRSFHEGLTLAKQALAASIPYYVDTNQTGEIASWAAASNQVLPLLTWTGLCDRIRIPTNYLTYSPHRREFNGLGGSTTDAGVIGHAHGGTNEFTAAGGPYFPSGRSTWYTTDYGYDPMKAILAEMALVSEDLRWTYWIIGYPSVESVFFRGIGDDWVASWDDAVSAAVDAYAQVSEATNALGFQYWGGSGYWNLGDFKCELLGHQNRFLTTIDTSAYPSVWLATNASSRMEVWSFIVPPLGSGASSNVFVSSDLGMGVVSQDVFCVLATSHFARTPALTSSWFGVWATNLLSSMALEGGPPVEDPPNSSAIMDFGCGVGEYGDSWWIIHRGQFRFP